MKIVFGIFFVNFVEKSESFSCRPCNDDALEQCQKSNCDENLEGIVLGLTQNSQYSKQLNLKNRKIDRIIFHL